MKTQLIQLLFILIPTITFSQMNSSFDFIFGIENSYRSLKTSSEDPFIQGLIESRDGRESNIMNWRIGFNYNKRLTTKLFLKTGIRLASVGYEDEKKTDLRWPSEIGPNGYVFDPSLPHEIQLTHNYWFLEIPLALRFEFTNKKFSPFIESGISPSVYLTTRTTSVTDIGTDVTYQKNGTSDFTSMHLVGMVSIGTNFTVNEKFQLFGQATYRYHLTKLADAPIEEHLYNYGIEIGVRRSI